MFLNKAYYLLKPILPWRLRLALRRSRASLRRKAYAGVWPMDPESGATPANWPGWPAKHRFALVLTHDVEGRKGLDRVERLMNLESRYGFRSSFNFVPEGEYRLPDSLRDAIRRAGCETGVHGLQHDGKLYSSKEEFALRSARIREYMRQWDAVGFRSPLMQRKLSWLHQLNASYDASTFDTDPFEPEPDGAGTIFPFWVPGPQASGYVELPYTLVQDFTLFVVLQEKDTGIWKQKLDWIAERGGMALLNTHPDYMCFEGKAERDEFPVSYYEEFLQYARQKYEGAFWHALPREVASFYRTSVPQSSRNTRRKICMVTHSTYETDNRVRRYAEALVKRGDQVDVIAISGGDVPRGMEKISGVNAFRIQHRERNERSKWTYARRLFRFFLSSSLFLTRRHRELRYDLIHVHNVPDFLVFAAWYPKLTGTKLILDIHDIVPELFASKFGVREDDRYIDFLKWVEKASATFADHVIVSNHLWYETLIRRSVPREKCSVFLNHVDPAIFYPHARTRNDDKFVILFPGSFQWHQGLDIAIRAFAQVRQQVPNAELHLYGGGGTEPELVQLADSLGLNGSVRFCGSAPLHQIPDIIANADLGVVPKRADSFGNEAYSTKIMEFMSQGIPVVVSQTKIDRYYFDDSVVRFFPSGDAQAMAREILNVIRNQSLRASLIARGHEYVNHNSWDVRKQDYLNLVDSLCTQLFVAGEPTRFEPDRVARAASGSSTGGAS